MLDSILIDGLWEQSLGNQADLNLNPIPATASLGNLSKKLSLYKQLLLNI